MDSMDSMDGLEEEEFHSKDTISQILLPNLVDSFPPWKQWKDRWGALPFLLHIIFVVILLFIGTIIALTSPNVDSTETSSIEEDSSYFHTGPQRYNPYEDLFDYFTIALSKTELARIFSAVLLCGFLGEVLSVGFLLLILKFPNGMIYMCLLYSVGICFIVSILFFTIGGWFIGSVLVLVNILFFVCFFLWRKRMEFSAVLLHAFTDVLVQIPHSLGITAGVVFIYFIWYLIWTATILISQQLAILGDGFVVIAFLYLMFSWYWTLQVFKNSVHIIVAGHVAYWYYDISQSNRYIVKNTLYRALVSFGSICIGSLIFPPIHVLRSITLKFSQLSNINPNLISLQRKLTVLCDAVLALFHFANVYGVAEMAMYGSSLRSSSQASLMVLLSYGVETMLHDSLVVNMVGLGAVMCSLITGLFASVGAWLMGSSYFFLVFLLTSLFGGSVFMLVSEVLYASGNSLFLCACRLSPDKLTKEFPKLITIIKDKYATRCLLVD